MIRTLFPPVIGTLPIICAWFPPLVDTPPIGITRLATGDPYEPSRTDIDESDV